MGKSKSDPGTFLKNSVPPKPPLEQCLLAAFAEAPGREEMQQGEPLVGPSGKIFNFVLYQLGIKRRYVHLDNLCRTKLPYNDTGYLWKVTRTGRFKAHPDWDDLVARMINDIKELPDAPVILLGSTPLVAMLGAEYGSIDSYRGYHFWQHGKLCMPTYHPARCLPGRAPHFRYIIYADILKAIRIHKEGTHNEPIQSFIPGRGWQTSVL